jgi:uncharacterized protein YjbI with pentapeptide repeats
MKAYFRAFVSNLYVSIKTGVSDIPTLSSKNPVKTLIILGVLAYFGWMFYARIIQNRLPADWTGVGSYQTTTIQETDTGEIITIEHHPGKTLWDWMELMIIPAMLGAGAWYLTRQERKNELEIAERRIKEDRRISEERNQDEFLQNYLDKMTELLLDRELRSEKAENDSPVRDVAHVRTITAFRKLDMGRRDLILQFLRDAELLDSLLVSASLQGADLRWAKLNGADLRWAKLMFADLREANLNRTNLGWANLSRANLEGANLSRANLSRANLNRTVLVGADLSGADLSGADLSGADLLLADLDNADLDGAFLTPDQLWGTIIVPEKYLSEPKKWLRSPDDEESSESDT